LVGLDVVGTFLFVFVCWLVVLLLFVTFTPFWFTVCLPFTVPLRFYVYGLVCCWLRFCVCVCGSGCFMVVTFGYPVCYVLLRLITTLYTFVVCVGWLVVRYRLVATTVWLPRYVVCSGLLRVSRCLFRRAFVGLLFPFTFRSGFLLGFVTWRTFFVYVGYVYPLVVITFGSRYVHTLRCLVVTL